MMTSVKSWTDYGKTCIIFCFMIKPKRIAQGFRGQRLVVLPSAVRARVQTHPLLRGLLVTDAGIFPQVKLHFIERSHGASTTLLIVCLAGRGWFRLAAGPAQPVTPGTVVWLPAQQAHAYGATEKEPWTIEWVHFQGEEVDSWRNLLGIPLEGGALSLAPSLAGELRVGQVWAHLDHGYTPANLAAAGGILRYALARAAKKGLMADGQRSAAERVAASVVWMKSRLAEPLRLAELANHSGLSVPHYTVLFRRHTGFTPIDWFIRLRIQWACELLDTCQCSVGEIARQTGFSDPYYFTRCFRRVVGVSPRQYRRVPKG
jgi:AraC family transcriptional regulator, arabinose operon regulatory protein